MHTPHGTSRSRLHAVPRQPPRQSRRLSNPIGSTRRGSREGRREVHHWRCLKTNHWRSECIRAMRRHLLLAAFVVAVVATLSSRPVRGDIDSLLKIINSRNYDRGVLPKLNGEPVIVNCHLTIMEFGSIEESTMEYQIMVHQGMEWTDPRLVHKTGNGNSTWVDPGNRLMGSIWKPRLHYSNEKRGSFHDITMPNALLRIFNNGTVSYSIRLSLTLACPMDLRNFPMDTQICPIYLESFSSMVSDLEFRWATPEAVFVSKFIRLNEFSLGPHIIVKNGAQNYSVGTYSQISVTFSLRRETGFYVIQIYAPSTLIVVVSWLSSWMKTQAMVARVALGITTVLTMTTQISGSRFSLPKLSYITAMDIWMTTCLVFVFSALLESVLVSVLEQKEGTAAQKQQQQQQMQQQMQQQQTQVSARQESSERAARLDAASRVVLPVSFALFNLHYWLVFYVALQR
ncbi:LOW QUALITY PROTEIN: glycine receptor subunit alpha-2-like [Lethenteron reissneri]|uniref:LOW QUALITY PROTEIN: glycine receptor subunit alpha-2-like n=1 Tax=Lethenteron reissneri TaxID=7753 RepID=UPI002AB7B64A|nr:LOW QUALITY PROTEIN: glycine receptor subunit alpha-2-like [Lethenteron reissneri]